MNRISKKFNELKKQNRKALVTFITAGDPSLSETKKLVLTLQESGADIIELGVPFSDPMADGPVIQASSERALKKKVNLLKILGLASEIRKKSEVPLLLMGYYNPIFVMGVEKFAKKAAGAGVDAVLVVDLPPEEAGELKKELKKVKIDLVMLLAPTSDESRILKALKIASGFVYYVSITGITGAKLGAAKEVQDQIDKIKSKTKLPVIAGFGIATPKDAALMGGMADGIVVGSALVRLIHQKSKQKNLHQSVSHFTSSLKKVL